MKLLGAVPVYESEHVPADAVMVALPPVFEPRQPGESLDAWARRVVTTYPTRFVVVRGVSHADVRP